MQLVQVEMFEQRTQFVRVLQLMQEEEGPR